MNAYDIIRRPVITEQSMESVADKKYVFMVDVNANKTEIKAAIEQIFGVKVAKVNTVRMQGKVKRTGAYPAGTQRRLQEGCRHPDRRLQDHRVLRGYGLNQISIKERNANGY